MTPLVLIRHAQPLVTAGTPPDQWPLTEEGSHDARLLGRGLAADSISTVVFTSPELKARQTAALAFPAVAVHVLERLREVERPWYAEPDELNLAAARYLRGEVVEGWERRQDVIARLSSLMPGGTPGERVVIVSHGILMTTWIHHEIGLEYPYRFWSDLRLPDAWELHPGQHLLQRVA